MNRLSFRMVARTEPAGKYNPTAPRDGNEDSFIVLPDVGNTDTALSSDTLLPLPEKGVLMVVADGMGGHNAGEVASQIAVETVREMFAAPRIADKRFDTAKARADYLEDIVVAADKNIRADANANPERQGMGSTIVMAWIVGNELTVTWCGDSRAYRYRPGKGLEMLSEDHSMVQDMVREHRITYEETFGHPQGNIITRCLGGGGKSNANPESRQFTVEEGDQIMLCSDGLSGVLFDDDRKNKLGEPYSDANLQDILSRPKNSMIDTLACLFDAARLADWYDNVTVILLEVCATPAGSEVVPESTPTVVPAAKTEEPATTDNASANKKGGKRVRPIVWVAAAVVAAVVALLLCKPCGIRCHEEAVADSVKTDSTGIVSQKDGEKAVKDTENAGTTVATTGSTAATPSTEQTEDTNSTHDDELTPTSEDE